MKGQKNRILWYFTFSLFVLFAIVVLLVLLFVHRNRERIIGQNQQYLEDASLQSVKNINMLLDSASNNISLVAHLYELQLEEPKFDHRLLNSMAEPTVFNYIRFIGLDGISYSGDGSQVDCRDREYYLEGIQGRSGICYVNSSRFTNEAILNIYTPLYYEGEIVGVVNGIITCNYLSEHMESSYFGESAKTYLCLRDGTLIAAYGDDRLPGNIIDELGKSNLLTAADFTGLTEAMHAGHSYSCLYQEARGVGNAYLAPTADEDFMLLQTFPPAASQSIIKNANGDAIRLEIALIVSFLVYIALIAAYAIWRNNHLLREKNDLGQIVDSVKRLYRRFVVFDLEKDSYEYLTEGDISSLGLPASGKYSEWLEIFHSQHETNPKYWNSMENMSIEQLRQNLTQENWYAQRDYPVPGNRWERLSLIKLDMDEEITSRVLGAVEDITESKQKDEEARQALETAFHAAEAANRAKSDFLSRMSHDIRTPMNAIIGLTAIMGARLDDRDRVVDCLAKITSSSKHLLGLINEVLDMSKIESGKLVLTDSEFSLSVLMDDLLSIIQPTVKAKHQELSVHVQNLTHEDVIGDGLRLQQVFVNILSNAVKYTGEGGHISVTISELPGKQPLLGEYEFIVRDDGIGMSPEFLEKIFSPFERANDANVSQIQGTGLGMSIAQSIVQLMGGGISVDSTLGKGSVFTVRVSLKLQEINEEAEKRLEGMPVLVADDDRIACESACLLLGELGMQSEWVLTGREAVEKVISHRERNEDFFAVILDWKMPEMDGVETAREIRRQVGPNVPIIILSAYDWSEIENEAREAGVNAFIGKPLFKSRLRGVFVNLLSETTTESADPLSTIRGDKYAGRQVLLVEDNELNQEIAKEILEMSGLTVDIAENGRVAVDLFAASAPGYYSMIFMDMQMPVMNGCDATKAIRALEREDAAKIPIMAMTANTFNDDVRAALDAGMNQHIAKPIDIGQLASVLEKWLGQETSSV